MTADPPFRPWSSAGERPLRLAVLISGGGTTLQNFIDVIARGELRATIELVVSSRSECGGNARAERAGLPLAIIRRKDFTSVEEFSAAIFSACDARGIDLVLCGGFLALLKVDPRYRGRVMNIHPSLVPAFAGQGFHGELVHTAALERGVTVSGCTVHFVDDVYDHGPIISQSVVPVLPDDTPASLAARVFEAECVAFPDAVRRFSSGRLVIRGSRVYEADVAAPSQG